MEALHHHKNPPIYRTSHRTRRVNFSIFNRRLQKCTFLRKPLNQRMNECGRGCGTMQALIVAALWCKCRKNITCCWGWKNAKFIVTSSSPASLGCSYILVDNFKLYLWKIAWSRWHGNVIHISHHSNCSITALNTSKNDEKQKFWKFGETKFKFT